MNTNTLASYPRRLLSHYKWRAISVGKRFLPQKKEILMVFGGRAQHWPGMGSELYRTEKVFRHYINQCDTIIKELGEKSVLPNYKNTAPPDFFDEEANVLFVLASFQIAVFELLKSKRIVPNAVMGISLGEVTAVYAAGGYSLMDVLKEVACAVAVSRLEKKAYRIIHVQTSLEHARRVLKESPVELPIIYEVNEQGVLVFCHEDDQKTAEDFLTKRNIEGHIPYTDLSYPYHTKRIVRHRQLIHELTKDFHHKPLQCDFYSSILGSVTREGSILETDFWFKLKSQPVLTHAVLKQVAESNYNVVLHIGAPSFSEKHLVPNANFQPQLLYTILEGQPELELYKKTERILLKTKWHASGLHVNKKNELECFVEKINFYDPKFYENPLPYLKYLQKHGSVHYLPRQNEWIVLGYSEAEFVLKNPEIFSNTIHKTFDEYLLGADPPSHTLIRSLIQPLFTQQRFNMMAEYTSVKANELLENALLKDKFDLVNEFSVLLSQAVIAEFMGFTEEEAAKVKGCIHGHPYEMGFFENLKAFCKESLEQSPQSNRQSVAALLLLFVAEEKISFDAALSLMRLLWIAGMTTGSLLISSAIYLLAQDRDMQDRVRSDEQMMNKLIEECLRLDSPESEIRRITKCETKLGSHILPAGATVIIKLLAANRDPEHFSDPDRAILDRPIKKHLSFGGGYHFCLGAGMARIEAKTAIKIILEKIPVLKIAENEVRYFPSPHLRGLGNLPILKTNPHQKA